MSGSSGGETFGFGLRIGGNLGEEQGKDGQLGEWYRTLWRILWLLPGVRAAGEGTEAGTCSAGRPNWGF